MKQFKKIVSKFPTRYLPRFLSFYFQIKFTFFSKDGSCNGLQHYAALGRDVLGGRSVNVLPSSKPQDVYSEIAAIVEQKRAEDEKNGRNRIHDKKLRLF